MIVWSLEMCRCRSPTPWTWTPRFTGIGIRAGGSLGVSASRFPLARRSISTSTINHHYQNESRLPVSLQRCDESSRTSTKGDGHTAPTRQRSGLVFGRRRVQITVTPTTSYQVYRSFQPLPLLSPDGKHSHHGRSLSCWNEHGRITSAERIAELSLCSVLSRSTS